MATPVGTGGLGVVRLSGPNAISIASRLFRGTTPLDQGLSHTLHHGVLTDGAEILDDAVAGLYRAPRSYTGEDVVEFSCHGGAHLLRRVLETCLRAGARSAEPGEYTRRAFLNGKMDLSQAEAVADLIAARSDAQRRLALAALRGAFAKSLRPLREKMVDLLAQLEARLDFVEDEIPDLTRADVGKKIDSLATDLAAILGVPGRGRLWREGIKIAIAGRPNVGKSSLFNALLKEDRAIVADRPGTTRDTLEESAIWDGVCVELVDTAGWRETDDAVEREGADRARRAVAEADAVFLVVEAGEGPSAGDREAAAMVGDRPVILVLNKADVFAPTASMADSVNSRWKKEVGRPGAVTVYVSARTGEGLDRLRRTALSVAGEGPEPREPSLAFNARQERCLRESLSALERARSSANGGSPEEVLSVDLRLALDGMNAVTGDGAPEEILNAIFSRFCVGK